MKSCYLFTTIVISSILILLRTFGISRQSLTFNYTLGAVCAMCISVLLERQNNILLNNTIWCFLGRYSYPIYLFHCNMLSISERIVSKLSINVYWKWGIKYILAVLLSSGLAVVLSKCFDEPIQRFIRKIHKYQ